MTSATIDDRHQKQHERIVTKHLARLFSCDANDKWSEEVYESEKKTLYTPIHLRNEWIWIDQYLLMSIRKLVKHISILCVAERFARLRGSTKYRALNITIETCRCNDRYGPPCTCPPFKRMASSRSRCTLGLSSHLMDEKKWVIPFHRKHFHLHMYRAGIFQHFSLMTWNINCIWLGNVTEKWLRCWDQPLIFVGVNVFENHKYRWIGFRCHFELIFTKFTLKVERKQRDPGGTLSVYDKWCLTYHPDHSQLT